VEECAIEGYSGAVLGRGLNGERGKMGWTFLIYDIHGVL
jgi:hypothetical protein